MVVALGIGCGSVGRAVASNTIGSRFKFNRRSKFVFTYCINKTKINKKGPRKTLWQIYSFNITTILNNEPITASFVHFRSSYNCLFLTYSTIQIAKSIDIVMGIRTRGYSIEGANGSIELPMSAPIYRR